MFTLPRYCYTFSGRRGPRGPHPPQHLISDFFILPDVCAIHSLDTVTGSLTSPGLPDLSFQICWRKLTFSVPTRLPKWSCNGKGWFFIQDTQSQGAGGLAGLALPWSCQQGTDSYSLPSLQDLAVLSISENRRLRLGTCSQHTGIRKAKTGRLWELRAGTGFQAHSDWSTHLTYIEGVFLLAHKVILSQGYCSLWTQPLIKQRKTAPMITLMPPALPATCFPGWRPSLLWAFLSLFPETVIQAKMSCGAKEQGVGSVPTFSGLRGLLTPSNLGLSDCQNPEGS